MKHKLILSKRTMLQIEEMNKIIGGHEPIKPIEPPSMPLDTPCRKHVQSCGGT